MLTEDKPRNIPVKDYLIKKMAVKMRISEETIDAVVNHQFKSVVEKMKTCNSIEISGFGRLLFSVKKAERYVGKLKEALHNMQNGLPSFIKRRSVTDVADDIVLLEKKLEHARTSQTNSAGVEE